jgi:two-component system, cell cycle sensor histidine kinase and response regulator CckA
MLRRIWDWFALAALDENEEARSARVLRGVTWALIGAAFVGLFFEALILRRPVLRVALWGGIGVFFASLWLTARGYLALARFSVTLTALAILTIVLYTGYSGIHSVTTLMLPAVIVIASLVLPRRGFFVITGLTVLSAAGLVVADVNGIIRTPYHDVASYLDLIAPALYLLFTALLVRALAADLSRSVDRARRNARDLFDANLRLERQADALEQSEARWRTYIEQASDLVIVLDTEGRLVSANRATCETLGYSRDELLGRLAFDLCEPDQRASAAEMIRHIMAGGRIDQVELRARTRLGDAVVLELRGRTLREHGHIVGTFHIGRDITARRRAEDERARNAELRERTESERRELEARVQQAHKLESLGRLAGGIAHDFNNLLMAILGNIDVALDLLPDGSPARDSLIAAGRASGRATELTRQMLAYAGRGKFSVELFDASELVTGMADMLRASVSKKVQLTFDLARGLPSIRGDVSQVRQVVMNLVVNASEALADRDGEVRVSTSAAFYDRPQLAAAWSGEALPEGRYVRIDVSDTGPGMDEETVARIFDPFFSTKFTGRGLGLAVVQGIVRGHGAAVKVDTRPGAGTAFQVLFPAESITHAFARDLGQGVSSSGFGTVLLVDDEESVRQSARAMLERLGYSVIEAPDGREAVALFEANRTAVRCVLLDLSMPRVDGEEALRLLRLVDRRVRVVVSSGYGEQEANRRLADDEPPAGFIQKPYTIRSLAEALSKAMA